MWRFFTPFRLAILSLAGSLFPAGFSVAVMHGVSPILSVEGSSLTAEERQFRILFVLIPVVCAIGSWLGLFWGIRKKRWTESEVAVVRRCFEHQVWVWIAGVFFLGSILMLVSSSRGSALLLMLPGQAILNLLNIVRVKTAGRRSMLGLESW